MNKRQKDYNKVEAFKATNPNATTEAALAATKVSGSNYYKAKADLNNTKPVTRSYKKKANRTNPTEDLAVNTVTLPGFNYTVRTETANRVIALIGNPKDIAEALGL